jgi:hypothetical protein
VDVPNKSRFGAGRSSFGEAKGTKRTGLAEQRKGYDGKR